MHSKILAAQNFVRLAEVAAELGLAETLNVPVQAALDLVPRKDAWATTMVSALAGRFASKTLKDLLVDPRTQAWLFGHGRDRAPEVMQLLRRYVDLRAKELGVPDGDEPESADKPEKSEKSEKSDKFEKSERSERPEKKDGSGSHGSKPAGERAAAAKKKHRWPDSEHALVLWAREHDVEELLDDPISAAVTAPDHPVRHVAYGAYGRHKLRHVLIPESLGGATGDERALATADLLEGSFTKREIELLRDAAWSYLEARAADVKAGAEEEQALFARLEAPPEEPSERRLFDELLRARREARRAVRPRPRAVIGDAKLTTSKSPVEDGALQLHWQEPEDADRPQLSRLRPSAVTITLDPFEDLAIRAQCQCTPGRANACVHALAMIDHLLGALMAHEEVLAPVLEQIRRPRWARAFGAIDRVEDRAARRAERADEQRLWWQIHAGLGGLELQPWVQQRGKRGDFLKARVIGLDRLLKQPESWTLPQDAKVVELFGGSAQAAKTFSYVRRALRLLVGHPRVFYGEQHDEPLDVRAEVVKIAADEGADGELLLAPQLEGRALDTTELRALVDDAAKNELIIRLDPAAKKCVLIALDEDQRALLSVLVRHGYAFPREARPELLRRLPGLGRRLPIALPPTLGAHTPATDRLVLRMEPEDTVLRVDAIVRPVESGPQFPPGEGPHEVLGARGSELVSVRRELEKERALASKWLGRLELEPSPEPPHYTWVLPLERALALMEVLRDLTSGEAPQAAGELVVEWPKGQSWKVSRRAGTADLKVTVSDQRDWFGLEGELEIDGNKVALGKLLEAARKNRAFVEVGSGQWIALADELRARLARVEDVVVPVRDRLEVAPAAALALEELVETAGALEASAKFRALLDEVERSKGYEPTKPEVIDAELRDYQLEGYRWMARLARWGAGAVLADDMGLGKTLQALSVLSDRAALGPQLVVAPTSVCFNWVRETRRFAKNLEPVLYRQLGAGELEALGPGQLLVLSYGLLARDADALEKVPFASVVLDEAQAIKNYATRRARGARKLQAGWRLALTGTPVENHLGELWSIFRAVTPGLLGSWEHFRAHFAAPIERDKDVDRRRALARTLRPFILRRTKAEVLKALPPRTEIEVEIELSRDERRLYDAVRLAALTEIEELKAAKADAAERSLIPKAGEVTDETMAELAAEGEGGGGDPGRFRVLAAITRLRQLACNPALYDEGSTVPSSKLARFMELVRALRTEGHRALVFSQFTRHLGLVRRALDAERIPYLYLDGSTPAAERERLVDAFQHGDADLFLISLKAGGTGLNLTAADYVFHLDPWWNPAVEDQATDRAHRIGQERPVTVYRLVSRGTIEEAIISLHADKRELVRDLLEGTDAAAKISTDELVRLIREGGRAELAEGEGDGDAEVAALEAESAPVLDAVVPGSAGPLEPDGE